MNRCGLRLLPGWLAAETPGDFFETRIRPLLVANCYTCHEQHGAVDTTFTQFYPAALDVAKEKKTLSPAFMGEASTPAK